MGGIYGRIQELDDQVVELEVAPGTSFRVARTAISRKVEGQTCAVIVLRLIFACHRVPSRLIAVLVTRHHAPAGPRPPGRHLRRARPEEGVQASPTPWARRSNIIRNRVDSLGVAEPEISRQGNNIIIDLPGVEGP